MQAFVRKAARSGVASVFVGLLIISFAFWGVKDFANNARSDNVAIVAGKPITATEYKAEFERAIQGLSQSNGRNITAQDMVSSGQDKAVLEKLVSDRSLKVLLAKIGINIDDSIIKSEIAKISAFINPQTGKFSEEAYQQTLKQNGYTTQSFENSVRADMAKQLLLLAATSGLHAPVPYAKQTLYYGTERRSVTMIPVPVNLLGQPAAPTDKDLQDLYNKNKDKLMRPESRNLTFVVASMGDFTRAAASKIADAKVKAFFEANKAKLEIPAKRSFVAIVANDQNTANAAAALLAKGENPNTIAQSLKLSSPIIMQQKSMAEVPDKGVAQAVFAAQKGATGSVKGDLAFAAYKVIDATEAKTQNYAVAAPKIREEMAKAEAGRNLTLATDTYQKLVSQGVNVEDAAKQSGLKIIKVASVTQDGKDGKTGQPINGLEEMQGALKSAFSIARGAATDLIDAPNNSYIAIRVDNIAPPAPVPFEEVKQELATEFMRNQARERLSALASDIANEAKKSGLAAAAKKYGTIVETQQRTLIRGQGSQQLSDAVFNANKGDIVFGPVANGVEFAVVQVNQVLHDDENIAKQRFIEAGDAVKGSVQQDIMQSLTKLAANQANVKLYPNRISAILGIESKKPAK